MYKLYCRAFQNIFKFSSTFLPWREPKLLTGANSLLQLPAHLNNINVDKVLIVTDKDLMSIGLLDELLEHLQNANIKYFIYDKTIPNPTITNIEDALQLYHANDCNGIIAFGGGSPMDCAKGVGARVARPNKSIPQMRGVLKIRKKTPPLFAVPTTAGTGSEGTIAAVVSNNETHEKYALIDHSLFPQVAVLDPLLTVKLPKHITSTTGMDALTHAVEAYIGKANTKETKQNSRAAVKLIFDNLYESYANGSNVDARANMLKASYLAGLAFTRAFVGNVHAIAHTLSGFYSTPHGLANAIILPHVLAYYGEAVYEPLAELADLIEITHPSDSVQQKAEKFITAIRKLNEDMEIPTTISCILEKDLPIMIDRALKEANPLYPVPVIFSKDDMLHIYRTIAE